MAEQTFRSPGFFEQEIDLSARKATPLGVPAGVIGTADRGPAFVPVTVGTFTDFKIRFGDLHRDRFGPYAVNEFMKHRSALTYLRVLGAGANETSTDMTNTKTKGIVKNAGFRLTGSLTSTKGAGAKAQGDVKFLTAQHTPAANEAAADRRFTDNQSYGDAQAALVRGIIFCATGSKIEILSATEAYRTAHVLDGIVTPGAIGGTSLTDTKYFKLVISSSTGGTAFGNDERRAGIRILTASLDPKDGHYIAKVLNTDPLKFQEHEHLLYADFAVEHELAPLRVAARVCIQSGSSRTDKDTSIKFHELFGRYDTRYTTPRTSTFISQPYGKKEFDLFHFETISDGVYGNDKFKISIANLRASTDPKNPWGTFEVQLRTINDKDTNTEILERFPECDLNPRSERYVAKMIGDKKVYYDFDQEDPDERRLVISGKYPNKSNRIRIRMVTQVEDGDIPRDSLPFGFRGIPVLKTSDTLTDTATALTTADGQRTLGDTATRRLAGQVESSEHSRAIIPPLPFRYKVTRGAMQSSASPSFVGIPSTNERTDARFYWGVQTQRIPTSDALSSPVLQPNVGAKFNNLVTAYGKFMGIQKLDALVTGSGKDEFNSNKFTLSRVAFSNRTSNNLLSDVFAVFTGSNREHMLEAAYIRNAHVDPNTYVVSDGTGNTAGSSRFTLASLVHTSSVLFNRFTDYAKFTNIFYGGFDGVNILDKDAFLFRDRAFSVAGGGKAIDGDPDIGLSTISSDNQMGEGRKNNANASVRRAVDIMTDPMSSNINILAIPGVRETYVTDYALSKVKDYSMAIYLMDSLKYDEDGTRLYDDSTSRVDVRETSEKFEGRAIDNNYAATYFPDVFIEDTTNNLVVKVPASVAALATLSYNDKVAFPWFAPAGFNRGGMNFVKNIESRLTSADRDTLYDARINPIAVFPNTGFVIFGQKTMQFSKSALDRVNVRRLMLEIKRQVVRIADKVLFEPNNAVTRAFFTGQVIPALAGIQLAAGIEQFKVICDGTNNAAEDVESNRMNGRIIVVPTRAVEFISIDFIVTNSGVSFE